MRVQYIDREDARWLASSVPTIVRVEKAPNVILDTIKRGDDDDFLSASAAKTVVCRLYESKGGHARAVISSTLPIKAARIVDLLERPVAEVNLKSSQDGQHSFTVDFRGFEVKTILLEV